MRAASAAFRRRLEDRHACLDGFAQPYVVCNQEADSRHLDRTHHGIKLVIFDVDSAAKGSLDRLHIRGGCGSPAHGVEERIEADRLVVAGRIGALVRGNKCSSRPWPS